MVDENAPEEKTEEESGGKKKSKLLRIIIIASLTFLIVGAAGYIGMIMVMKDDSAVETDGETEGEADTGEEEVVEEPPVDEFGKVFIMNPFVVNLNDPGGTRYLKTKIDIEYMDDIVGQELASRLPQMRDLILLLLSSKNLKDVQSVGGKIELRNELISRINSKLKSGRIKNLYFTEFVVQ